MIVDKEQFDRFLNIMPDLEDDEVYFLSLSARNKYLTDEERIEYGLGRTEMFGRTIVKSKDEFGYAFSKLKSMLTYKHTKIGKLIPEKCLIIYMNVNPSSTIKAYEQFTNEMNKELFQVYQATKHQKQVNYLGFNNIEKKLMNSIQKSTSRRYFLDIDMDTDDSDLVKKFSKELKDTVHHIIQTQGGYHILIKKDTLSKDIKLHELVKDSNLIASKNSGEVVFNKNMMVPVPGTLQAGKLVYLYL